VVGQHVEFSLLLEDVEKVAAKTIEAGIVSCHAGNGRVDGRGLQGVFEPMGAGRSRREW